jgi:hypothetical protein
VKASFKIVAAGLLAGPIAVMTSAPLAAQVWDDVSAALPDTLCDYCKDFSDAANAGPVRSSYRPGVGYATERQDQAAFLQEQERQKSGLRLVARQVEGTAKPMKTDRGETSPAPPEAK